jgi:hypothetical protein
VNASLIDEFSIALSPVLFGSGIRLFDGVDAGRVALEQVRAEPTHRVTHLTYASSSSRMRAKSITRTSLSPAFSCSEIPRPESLAHQAQIEGRSAPSSTAWASVPE